MLQYLLDAHIFTWHCLGKKQLNVFENACLMVTGLHKAKNNQKERVKHVRSCNM